MKPELKQFADHLLDDLCRSHPLGFRPALLWKPYRVTAGMAYFQLKAIGLSRFVLTDEARVRETLTHEYAHLLAFVRHGRKGVGHGKPWKQAMLDLGVAPTVHHKFEVKRNAPRQKVTYQCQRCGTLIDRARRLPRKRQYLHANCGGGIKLKSVERLDV